MQLQGTFSLTQHNKSVTYSVGTNTHGLVAGDYVRFATIDNVESYKVDAVNTSNGALTLNRGYRGATGATVAGSQRNS